ncbi:Cyclic nucleotide-binding domain-containing protein [Polaromonas sp. OV174]|uniref:cyclic nucleotide-binding domain-containing protein n=1 Tax=Polaromonas sp. OV174 TaxID=1855300 RepID=UPI0008F07644|nr:cyclic nucleotide-binding domain-containing protein [Polaromonas sp. OV174]SFB86110.1 Cyclic nucleotide-binding domain-containing protein [Polaromonas sp. OV174]
MFNKFFRTKHAAASGDALSMGDAATAQLAAKLLITPCAMLQLTPEDARTVVRYMRLHRIAQGTTFIREGDTQNTGFMLLLIDGEVTVENIVVSRVEPITVTVLGQGSLIGEMGLLDGEPRAASCTASSHVRCASLSREALERLVQDAPAVAAKLMLAVSLRIAHRLRDNADKLKMYVQLTQVMQQELSHHTAA